MHLSACVLFFLPAYALTCINADPNGRVLSVYLSDNILSSQHLMEHCSVHHVKWNECGRKAEPQKDLACHLNLKAGQGEQEPVSPLFLWRRFAVQVGEIVDQALPKA